MQVAILLLFILLDILIMAGLKRAAFSASLMFTRRLSLFIFFLNYVTAFLQMVDDIGNGGFVPGAPSA